MNQGSCGKCAGQGWERDGSGFWWHADRSRPCVPPWVLRHHTYALPLPMNVQLSLTLGPAMPRVSQVAAQPSSVLAYPE